MIDDPTKQAPAAKATDVPADERLVRALKHPLRLELLRRFLERTATPVEMSKELGEPLGNVAYHCRELVEVGYLELVRTEPRRGALAKYYRATVRAKIPDAESALLSEDERAAVSSRILQNMFGEAIAALRSGTMDRRVRRHLSWYFLALDEEGWGQLGDLLIRVEAEVEDIETESTTRRVETGEPAVPAVVGLMSFERSP